MHAVNVQRGTTFLLLFPFMFMSADVYTSGTSTLLLQLSAASERNRLPLLQSLSERLLHTDPAQGLTYAEQAYDLAERLNRRAELPYCLKQIGLCHAAMEDYIRASSALRKGLALFAQQENRQEMAEICLELAHSEVERGRYQEGANRYQEALQYSGELGYDAGGVIALKGMGDLYCRLADHRKGLDHYLQGLRVAERTGSPEMTGILLFDIAVIYGELKEYDRARDYFEQSLEAFNSCGLKHLEVRALANLASVYTEQAMPDDALDYGLRAMTVYEALNDRYGLATTLANLSNIYKMLEQLDAAIECCRKSYDLFESLDDHTGRCAALLNTGMLYQSIDQHHHATYVLEQALRIAEENGTPELRYQCHHLLSRSLEEVGDSGRALRHLRAYVELRETLEQEEQRRAITEMQARFDLEQMEKEKEIYRLRNEQLEMENKHKTAELTSLSMQLVEKNRFINDVKLAIEKIGQEAGQDIQPLVRNVLRNIKKNITTQEDWQAFEEQFEKVHHDFIRKLSQQYPDLTSMELKVCALIRTGLSSGEIAALLHVTRRNVETHRYRLRKKLTIASEIDLGTFLASV